MSSRMRICVRVESVRSSTDAAIAGSLITSNAVMCAVPSTVKRTWYLPGAAIGMPVDGVIPQCVIRRTWTSLNRSSSQMCGLSGGVVISSTSFGASSVRSQLMPFNPACSETICVLTTLPPESRISIFTGPAGAVASASWKCGRLACW